MSKSNRAPRAQFPPETAVWLADQLDDWAESYESEAEGGEESAEFQRTIQQLQDWAAQIRLGRQDLTKRQLEEVIFHLYQKAQGEDE